MKTFITSLRSTFLPRYGAAPFFASVILWGMGTGCFTASLNNFLVEIHHITEWQRGLLEFFREMPGLLLVFILALLHRTSDWKILRISAMISMAGIALMFLPVSKIWITLLIMVWSTGEHLVMPVRSGIAMQVARPQKAGASLGFVSSAQNGGTVVGSLLVAAIFFVGQHSLGVANRFTLYRVVWGMVFLLVAAALVCSFSPRAPRIPSKRPRLHFAAKYRLFYGLELFYGARKQIFMTFAPFVLIKEYGMDTTRIALIMGISAAINMLGGPLVGWITDRLGYRTVMFYDTVILVFVCLLYGYAGDWFSPAVAFWVICFNFLLDGVISTTSMATSIYVRDMSSSRDETTSTLSTGISINHFISILAAPLGGFVWMRWGVGTLFSFAALMAIGNSYCAMLIPIKNKAFN